MRTPNLKDFYASPDALNIYKMLKDRRLASKAISALLVANFHTNPNKRAEALRTIERIKRQIGINAN